MNTLSSSQTPLDPSITAVSVTDSQKIPKQLLTLIKRMHSDKPKMTYASAVP